MEKLRNMARLNAALVNVLMALGISPRHALGQAMENMEWGSSRAPMP